MIGMGNFPSSHCLLNGIFDPWEAANMQDSMSLSHAWCTHLTTVEAPGILMRVFAVGSHLANTS